MGSVSLAPTLSPHGRLGLAEAPDAPTLEPEVAQRLRDAFERGSGHGLLQLGAAEAGAALPPVFSYWREFGAWYVTRPLHTSGCRCAAAEGACPRAAGRGVGPVGSGGASHDWRGVSDRGGPRRSLAGTGRRVRHRTGGIEMRDPGLPEAPQSGVEPGRPRALQSGREPQGPGCAVRLSRHLHHATVGARKGSTSSAGEGSAASMRARQTRTACCPCFSPCSEPRRPAPG